MSSLARPPQLLSFCEVKTIHYIVEFSINIACLEKNGKIVEFTKAKKCKELQKSLKNSGFIPAKACGLQDDVILFCLALWTTP